MPVTARDTIKQWFETNDYPTQEQFWNWLESYVHKNDLIPVARIDGLSDLINNVPIEGTATSSTPLELIVPAGTFINGIVFIPDGGSDSTVKAGLTSGGTDLWPDDAPFVANDPVVLVPYQRYYKDETTLFFEVEDAACVIKIFKQ
jgi:hypothetical protein